MSSGKVKLEIKAPLAIITLNKPERLNALDFAMWDELRAAAEQIDAAADVRVAILRGAGGAFCAGLDVKAGSTLFGLQPASQAVAMTQIREHIGRLQVCFTRLERLRVPLIAAIDRVCIGAGMEIALCCDIRVAAEGALFSIPEVQLGLIPDMGGTQRLPRTVGIGMAKELIYSARRIDANEALRIGLVNHVYPVAELAVRSEALAMEIAANAPLAVQAAKRAVDGTYWQDREAWLAWEANQAVAPLVSEDCKIGMRAAAERSRAEFLGK